MNAEEAKVGCFQMVIVLLLGMNYVIVAMSHALPVFHNYTPKFYCQARNATNKTYGCQTLNSSIGSNVTIESPEPASCPGEYRFLTEVGENSVAIEWGLICHRRYLTLLGPSVYYVGVLIGAWVAGLLTDRIGRLPVQAICLYTQGTMAVALYVVQSYPAFLALRGLQGVFAQGLQNSTYILSLELFPAKARTFVALIMQIAWAIGLVLLAVLSYVVPDWRILQLAISVPTAITVLYIWVIPESPRWLLAKGKSTEADMALERIAKYNGCCSRKSRKSDSKSEVSVNEITTPVKPERKSRLSNVDVKKAREEGTQEERSDLLTTSELVQQKIRKTSFTAASENFEKRLSNGERAESLNGETVEKRVVPSSSRNDRKTKSVSQPVCSQRVSLKAVDEIVELRTPTRKEDLNESQYRKSIQETLKEKDQSLRELFQHTMPRRYILIMICQWLTSSMAYHCIENLVPNFFFVNRHVTFALGGALEIATYTFMYFVLSRYGRRLPMCICQSLNGIVCIVVAVFVIFTNSSAGWAGLAKCMVLLFGKVTVISTIFIAYLYTIEVFPTVIRGSCLGFCVVFAKIGSLVSVHVVSMEEYLPIAIPLIILGLLCLISGAFIPIMPETLNKILPDTIEDTKQLIVKMRNKNDNQILNNEKVVAKDDLTDREILRDKLFSEDWVDAGNGILVNFSENKAD